MIPTFLDTLNNLITSNIIATIGLLLIVSFLGSKIFQRFGIPQVVGFIILGVLHGPSVFNIIHMDLSADLILISEIALGLIGFDMGGHLHLNELRRLGKSIIFILIFEALGAFTLVASGVYLLSRSLPTALIFGALSSATAPAATVDVLAEYDAKGPLTTTLLAVVGLDDALSLLLYSIAAAFATSFLAGTGNPSFLEIIEIPFFEIGGSLVLGLSLGYLLDKLLSRMTKTHDAMAVSIGFVLLSAGISEVLGFSLILTCLVLGMMVVNCCPEHGKHIRYTVEQTGPVIYVLFFTLVGARFQIALLPTIGMIGIAYLGLRSCGKFFGAWLGGTIGGAQPVVRDNLGFGLLSQAGVAIGLALVSSRRFSGLGEAGEELSALVINVITATTFIVQIIGPILVKLAINRAGEIGKAIATDDDWASEM